LGKTNQLFQLFKFGLQAFVALYVIGLLVYLAASFVPLLLRIYAELELLGQ
jgi:hypothetical protein